MEKDQMLRLMRFWLFGTFIILFVAATLYVGVALGTGLLILKEFGYWLTMVVAAVLCALWYYFYKWFLERKE